MLGCAALLLAGCASPVTAYPAPNTLDIKSEAAIQKQMVRGNLTAMGQAQLGRGAGNADERFQRVALRVLTAAAPLCGMNIDPQLSIDIAPEPLDYPRIITVVPPPFQAGAVGNEFDIVPGDRLVRIGNQDIEVGHGGYRRAFELLAELELEGEPVSVAIKRGVETKDGDRPQILTRRIQNYPRCNYIVESIPRAKFPNAFADGEKIFMTTAMVRLMPTDDELAFVTAHELSHNIMRHSSKGQIDRQLGYLLGSAGDFALGWWGRNDEFAQLGTYLGSEIYSKDQEMEADYLGVYLMTSAGYDPDAALLAMRRLGFQNPVEIDDGGDDHPGTALRAAAIKTTIDEVKHKLRRRELLLPRIKDNRVQYDQKN